ncbi:thiamine biosynthesis protein ThiF [Paenibacillus sp. BIHB 4019]|uniref:Thiamine biosynthesis protein ThiF n=1 Tax=Paenibacillus sp. BIHB 4019 TaxID=1870819 RepID=A0A1B2DCU6_9BACL|nr:MULTISPECIES: ThiF family adenylyltransferase [unclassified Paenibacillus]ANY65550.1 thiamine biosynthesis protein ThiF [Paenibacillus sp. BIHB 4019]KQO12056.1 thiamine biosynthesis protein ThiF [Paenibacillus sp. Leaf72]
MDERYSRQMLFTPIGEAGQRKLSESAVLIIGMGALGTVLANHMVRAGVGLVRFVDRDYVERSNLQRQMLYDEEDVENGYPKAVAAEKKLRKINSDVKIEAIVADVTVQNIDALLADIDLVLDGTDNFQTRFLLNDACFRSGIPFTYGGAVSSRGMSAILVPGATPCLRCFIQSADAGGQTCDMIGVISPVVDIVASYQAVEALKYLVGAADKRRNSLMTFDLWQNHAFEMKLGEPAKQCPCCQLKQYPALQVAEQDAAVSLCGRSTVQISGGAPLHLEQWRQRLEPIAVELTHNAYLLKAELPEGERLVLFPDGRVLVQGTEDMVRAKTLYARYIGN